MRDDKGKIRVIVFELEGNNDTLQESLRSVANVITRGQPVARPATALLLPKGRTQAALPAPEMVDDMPTEPVESGGDNGEELPRKSTRQNRADRPPRVLSDVELKAGEMPFESFAQAKGAQKTWHRYLVVAAWFKRYRSLDAITQDHVYTCYRLMNWTDIPDNMGQPFRDMKRRGWFDNGEKRGCWQINHIGENCVDKMPGE